MNRLVAASARSAVTTSDRASLLFRGSKHKLTAFSERAGMYLSGLVRIGQNVGEAFVDREFKAAVAALDEVYETGETIVIRQRLWKSIPFKGPRPVVEVSFHPVFERAFSEVVVGVMVEARPVHGERRAAVDRVVPAGIPGGLPFYEALAVGDVDPMALLQIREAARSAFVDAATPLVEELLRRRRADGSTPRTLPGYQPRRPV